MMNEIIQKIHELVKILNNNPEMVPLEGKFKNYELMNNPQIEYGRTESIIPIGDGEIHLMNCGAIGIKYPCGHEEIYEYYPRWQSWDLIDWVEIEEEDKNESLDKNKL